MTEEWQKKIDNERTDFFWNNRNKEQDHPEEIDDEQVRCFYNLLRIYWIKKRKEGKESFVPEEQREDVSTILNIENPPELEKKILEKISKPSDFILPLYVIEKLNLFTEGFFEWAKKLFDGLCQRYEDKRNYEYINEEKKDEGLEFDFGDTNTTLVSKIFFNNENRRLLIASAIIDFIVSCNAPSSENIHDWMRLARNIICNLNVDNSNLENLLSSFECIKDGWSQISKKCSENGSCLHFIANDLKGSEKLAGIPKEALEEERKKARLILEDENKWRKRIEELENNRYFTGQIKFMFDFLGDTPEEHDFDQYSKMMKKIFSGDGKDGHYFSPDIDEKVFSRALLCFTTDYTTDYRYGYGYQINSNWSFLKSSKTDKNIWKNYINDSQINDSQIVGTEQRPHNDALKRLLDTIIQEHKSEVSTKTLEKVIESHKDNITDWRRFFIDYPKVWDYINPTDKFIRWGNEYDIGLVKSVRYGGSVYHAELRAYCLYLEYIEKYPEKTVEGWKFDFWELDSTCLYFQKEMPDGDTIAVDVSFEVKDASSEDNYNLEIFLRRKEGTDSQNYLKSMIEISPDFKVSKRGYMLKQNCSKEKIKDKIGEFLDKLR